MRYPFTHMNCPGEKCPQKETVMHYLLDTTETIAPGLGFAPFGPLHLGWLAAGVMFVLLSAVGYRRWKEPARRRWRNGVA